MSAATVELTIDAEFDELCFALTPEEQDLLEASLETEGCREPILVWANHDDTIIDGHNRYRICRSLGIAFKTKALKFDSREDVMNWIISNQLGRRNATEEQKSYLRGKRYLSEKHRKGGDRKSEESKSHSDTLIATDEKVAAEFGVSPATINRDAKFAAAIDDIAANVGKEARDAILTGKVKAEKKAVVDLAIKTPEQQKAAVASVQSGESKSLREASRKVSKPPAVAAKASTQLERGKEFDEKCRLLESVSQWIESTCQQPAGVALDRSALVDALDTAKRLLRAAKPVAACGKCKGKGCDSCNGRGLLFGPKKTAA